jgi:hypothetical protein
MGDAGMTAGGDAKSTEQRLAELEDNFKESVRELARGFKWVVEAAEHAAQSENVPQSERDSLNELAVKLKECISKACRHDPGCG